MIFLQVMNMWDIKEFFQKIKQDMKKYLQKQRRATDNH